MGLVQPAIIIILTFVFLQNATAQLGITSLGARAQAMGNAVVALEDNFSPFNNIGATSSIEKTTAVTAFENRFGFTPFQRFGAGIICPINIGVVSLAAQKAGGDLYNEQNYGLGFSNKFGIVSLGIQANYTQIFIKDTGVRGIPSLAFGGLAEILPSLFFGAHIYNLTQSAVSKEQNLFLPIILKSGVSYQASDALILSAEVEKDIDMDVRLKGGLEYMFLKKFSLRTGVTSSPFQHHFGVGFSPSVFFFDYAMTTHSEIGMIHQLSLAFQFRK